MKKRRTIKTALLVLAFLFVTIAAVAGSIFAYWHGQVTDPAQSDHSVSITIGEGKTYNDAVFNITDDLAAAGKTLVPVGKKDVSANPTTAVEEHTFNVKVKITSATAGTGTGIKKNVKLEKTEVLLGGAAANADLVVVTITGSPQEIEVNGTEVTYQVKVTLTEPTDKTQYEAIINKDIAIKFTASVVS